MANRDEILRELKVEEISHPEATNTIPFDVLIKFGILTYNQSNAFSNPRHIPDLGYVQYLISLIPTGSGGITTQNFTEADLLDLGGGNWYLPVMLGSTDLVLAVSSDVSGTKDQLQFSVSDGRIFGFPDNSAQNIIVKIG